MNNKSANLEEMKRRIQVSHVFSTRLSRMNLLANGQHRNKTALYFPTQLTLVKWKYLARLDHFVSDLV